MNFEPSCSQVDKSDEMRETQFYHSETSTYIYNEDDELTEEDMKKLKLYAGVAAVALGGVFFYRMFEYCKNIKTQVNTSIHHIHPTDVKVRFDLTLTNLSNEIVRFHNPEIILRSGSKIIARNEQKSFSYKLTTNDAIPVMPIFLSLDINKLAKIDPDGVAVYRRTGKWPPDRIKLEAEIRGAISEKYPYENRTEITI